MNINIKNNLGKISTGILCLALAMTTSSCDKFLDVRPEGEIPSEQLLDDAAGFESAMYGVYGSLNSNNLYGRTLSHETIDLLAQYYVCQGNQYVDNVKLYNYAYTDLESTLGSVWGSMYKNIANANNIIINLEKKDDKSMAHYDIYKGEALGLRAFMHFELLRLYTANIQSNPAATGIPYSIKFELSPSAFSNAAKVYELIIADLLAAEALLTKDSKYFTFPKVNPTEAYLRDRETHFNLYAVQATLARVYLTKGDKTNAAIYAKKVVDSQKFQLIDKGDIANNLPKGVLYPKETIFGLYNTANFAIVKQRFLDATTFFSYNMRDDLITTFKNEESGSEYRVNSYFKMPLNNQDPIRFVKLVDPYQVDNLVFLRPQGQLDGINLIRLPEMYYILAESLLESDPTAAMSYFNTAITSRGLIALDQRTPALPLTVERITAERYKEFMGEGQTFYNMKRLNLPIKNTDNVTIPASNQVYVWPIPNDEKEYNN